MLVCNQLQHIIVRIYYRKGRLNTDTSPQNFRTTFLANDLTEKFKKSAVASAIAIPLPLYISCFVPLRRSRENLTKPFYLYLSRTCDALAGTPSVFSLALKRLAIFSQYVPCTRDQCTTLNFIATLSRNLYEIPFARMESQICINFLSKPMIAFN